MGKLKGFKNWMRKCIKGAFTSETGKKHLRQGSYVSGITVIVIGIILVINLIVGQLPMTMTQLDVSSQKLYTLTDTTREMLSKLEADVTLYYVVSSGNEDSTVERMLEGYADSSPRIHLEVKDSSVYPKFAEQYKSGGVAENSIIAVCGDKSRVVDYSSMWETTFDYYTYSQQTSAYDGEGRLTSAISYVTSGETAKIYWSEGHGEASQSDLSASLSEAVEKNNLTVEELRLLTEDIPEDSRCLVICGPTGDFTSEEADKVIAYLEDGGHVLMLSSYTGEDMPNLDKILESYGVEISAGVIVEGDNKYYYPQYPYYLLPEIESDEMTASVSDYYVLMPIAQAIRTLESGRETLTMTSLLTTTDLSYIETDLNSSTWTPSENSEKGPFDVGLSVTETVEGGESHLAVFSCANMLDGQIDDAVSGNNSRLISDVIISMCDMEDSISVTSKSLSMESLVFTAGEVSFLSILTILIIPAAVLAVGLIVWLKRRKR